MAKKNYDDTTPIKKDPTKAETIPVRTSKSLFKEEPPLQRGNQEPLPVNEPQEDTSIKRTSQTRWIWLGLLGIFLISSLGGGIGYALAMSARFEAEKAQRITLATAQFVQAIDDEKKGNYNIAFQRLKYVLEIFPEFPGLDEKLKDVMLVIALNNIPVQVGTPSPNATSEPALTPVATQDTHSLSVLLDQAQAQYLASDWAGLLTTVNLLRDIDPGYEPVKVDGLYYYALRNMGISKIKSGSLEVGLYYFSLAEQMALIDTDADSYRQWAKMYDYAGSWWGVNWQLCAESFLQLYTLVPNLVDASGISVRQRYAGALAGYGDFLQSTNEWCNSLPQYEASLSLVTRDAVVTKLQQAREFCANPPPTPTPTLGPPTPTPVSP
jgi:tetratricopeptide (TPR) repeat protein